MFIKSTHIIEGAICFFISILLFSLNYGMIISKLRRFVNKEMLFFIFLFTYGIIYGKIYSTKIKKELKK